MGQRDTRLLLTDTDCSVFQAVYILLYTMRIMRMSESQRMYSMETVHFLLW